MHLARRAYFLALLTAVLAIVAIWSDGRDVAQPWRIVALLLLTGLALEGFLVRRTRVGVRLATAARAYLGKPQPAALIFENGARRARTLEFAAAVPAGFETSAQVRRVTAPARGAAQVALTLLPVRLGIQQWPPLPARLLGLLRLAWWSTALQPAERLVVAPDTLRTRRRPRGMTGGARLTSGDRKSVV
jgi:uncharacterized protein (DUF58 family)